MRECRKLEKELSQSKKLLREWLERLDRYLLDPDSSLYSEDILASKVKEYENQVKELEARLDKAHQNAAIETWENEQMRKFVELAPRWFDLFREAPLAQKKQMLRSIIDTVIIGRGVLTINCKLNLAEFNKSVEQEQLLGGETELVMPFRLTATV